MVKKTFGSQRDYSTESGAQELLGIIEANSPYKGKFWVEKTNLGLFVVRSNLLRGLPRENASVQDFRRDIQPKANGGAKRRASGKVHDGGA